MFLWFLSSVCETSGSVDQLLHSEHRVDPCFLLCSILLKCFLLIFKLLFYGLWHHTTSLLKHNWADLWRVNTSSSSALPHVSAGRTKELLNTRELWTSSFRAVEKSTIDFKIFYLKPQSEYWTWASQWCWTGRLHRFMDLMYPQQSFYLQIYSNMRNISLSWHIVTTTLWICSWYNEKWNNLKYKKMDESNFHGWTHICTW